MENLEIAWLLLTLTTLPLFANFLVLPNGSKVWLWHLSFNTSFFLPFRKKKPWISCTYFFLPIGTPFPMWNDEESKRILVDRIYYDQWQMLRKSRRDSPSVLRRWGRWKWEWQTPHDDFSHLDIRGRSLIFQQEHEIRLGEGRPQYN